MIDIIICGDCLEVMPQITNGSVDMILADLPYGVSECNWDTPLPLDILWQEWGRITKKESAIVLTASEPFTSRLVMSKPEWFRYAWIWDKVRGGNFYKAKYYPMKIHEDILVFGSEGEHTRYNPILVPRERVKTSKNYGVGCAYRGNRERKRGNTVYIYTHNYPKSIIRFSNAYQADKHHPTQKPVALFEYLIRTYTNEGDLVLDPTAGSGTTAVACRRSNRHYICIEKEAEYCATAEKRLKEML